MLRTRAPKMSRTANQRGPPADGGRRISAARSDGNLYSGTPRAVVSTLSPMRRGQSARSFAGSLLRFALAVLAWYQNFVDSSPNVGAWAKGRSSSGRLAAIPWVPTDFKLADAPTRGKPVRREPSSRSELADALLACAFDDRTDAAFDAGTRGVVSLSEFLEPVLGPPYDAGRRFTPPGLRRGDEDSLIGDGPPKGTARQRARSLTRARRAEKGTDLSTGNIGEILLKLRNATRADFDDFLRTSNAKCSYEAFMQWLDPDRAAKLLVAYGQSV